ncbi:MAG: hypothetical protein WDO19_19800 [Bacteroidota bacterium]
MDTQQKIVNANSVFTTHYLDSKVLYMYCFNSIPCISFINHIDGEKAFEAVKEKYGHMIESMHSYRAFERKKIKTDFDDTLLVLKNNSVLEFDKDYCEILHHYSSAVFVNELVEFLKTFKERQRRKTIRNKPDCEEWKLYGIKINGN